MATTIINAVALSGGDITSSEITSVGDLVLDIEVSASQTSGIGFKYDLKAKEGTAVSYKPVLDENGKAVVFSTSSNGSYRINIKGVDSDSVKLFVSVPAGSTGTMTALSTKTANPNT